MSKIELRKRKFDGKWVRWELKDSHATSGIGHTATWPRYKWVVTGVWNTKPKISDPCLQMGCHWCLEYKT